MERDNGGGKREKEVLVRKRAEKGDGDMEQGWETAAAWKGSRQRRYAPGRYFWEVKQGQGCGTGGGGMLRKDEGRERLFLLAGKRRRDDGRNKIGAPRGAILEGDFQRQIKT